MHVIKFSKACIAILFLCATEDNFHTIENKEKLQSEHNKIHLHMPNCTLSYHVTMIAIPLR